MDARLKIDPCFQNLIPPLSDEELQQLEQNILAEGCRDAIKLWRHYIIDGHNRYAICQKHNIPYSVQRIPLASKTDAKIWIAENQLGRRNLTAAIRIEIANKKAELLGQPRSLRQIAKIAGVSKDTVRKYMKIHAGDEVKHVDTRTVETLYNHLDLQYKNTPMCRAYMLSGTSRIEKMYGFLDGRILVALGADEVCMVKKLAKAQLEKIIDVMTPPKKP